MSSKELFVAKSIEKKHDILPIVEGKTPLRPIPQLKLRKEKINIETNIAETKPIVEAVKPIIVEEAVKPTIVVEVKPKIKPATPNAYHLNKQLMINLKAENEDLRAQIAKSKIPEPVKIAEPIKIAEPVKIAELVKVSKPIKGKFW